MDDYIYMISLCRYVFLYKSFWSENGLWLATSLAKIGKTICESPISGRCNDGIMVITYVMNGIFVGFVHDNNIQWIMENPIDYGVWWWLDRLCRNEMGLSILVRHSHIIHIIHSHPISRYCMVTQNAKRKSQRRSLKQTCELVLLSEFPVLTFV